MRRPLWLLNLFLGLVAALIGVALAKSWVSPVALTIPGATVAKPSHEAEALAYNPVARPPLTQFEVLLEKNPFKQPPPRPAGPAGPPPPPPIPLPSLVGTMLVGQERKAILSDRGKASIYSVGQEVAGGMIVDIKEDRIVFKRGDTTQEIMLKAAIAPAAATAIPPVTLAAGAPGGQMGQAVSHTPPPAEHPTDAAADASREERRRRREEQREQRRQLLEQRRANH
ncbi:MAG: hypothetical protein C3F08_02585 [Candidatus Methylomirabilota bacterium]|nr:MAG: hypothetical protein C3F08_02585 [candidate division NC10 bacterium]